MIETHRLIPTRFPPITLFEWASTPEEALALAALESLTNDRLHALPCLPEEEWIVGPGSSILMAPFTHPGPSRFSDGSFGIYYAAERIDTAIAETKYHRTQFLRASREGATLIQMREYTSTVMQPLERLTHTSHATLLDPALYENSQMFGEQKRIEACWGLHYPSVRDANGHCVAIFRPKALSMPVQGRHFDYIWNGDAIIEVRQSTLL